MARDVLLVGGVAQGRGLILLLLDGADDELAEAIREQFKSSLLQAKLRFFRDAIDDCILFHLQGIRIARIQMTPRATKKDKSGNLRVVARAINRAANVRHLRGRLTAAKMGTSPSLGHRANLVNLCHINRTIQRLRGQKKILKFCRISCRCTNRSSSEILFAYTIASHPKLDHSRGN